MKKVKMLSMYILICLISSMILSCAQQPQKKPSPKEDEPKPVPPVVEEMETEIISIMSEVDMVPYYKAQIDKKKEKEQEKKDLAIKLGMGSQSNNNQKQNENIKENQPQNQMGAIDELTKFEPKPMTINDILLLEILKAEAAGKNDSKTEEIPNDIVFIWHGINTKVGSLHKKWNMLESQVIKSGATQESIGGFENALNNLTMSASKYNFLDTLVYCNKLTFYIPDLVKNFKPKVPSPVYYMKYYLRQTILDCQINNYESALTNFSKLNIYKDALISQLIDKKLIELANKLNTSIKDLEHALKLKDLNIIKIKASVVMSNIQSVSDELSK